MALKSGKLRIKYAFLPFSISSLFGEDTVKNITPTEQKIDASVVKEETGLYRLRRMFSMDEFGNISVEAHSILQTGAMSAFFGGLYGGFIQSRIAFMDFMKNNQATSFSNHFEAKRKLQDKVTMGFARGGFKWAWRLALFSTSFVGISTMISVYKGESGISEYVVAGTATGILYKFNLGPRGWLVGGGLGAVLGFFCGCTTIGLLSLSGISMDEARYWQYHWKQSRNEYFRQGLEEYLSKEDFAVIKLHDEEVGAAGKDIANLDKNVKEHSKSDNK